MKRGLIMVLLPIMAFGLGFLMTCDMFSGTDGDDDGGGGVGADFDSTEYYTKSEIDQLFAENMEPYWTHIGTDGWLNITADSWETVEFDFLHDSSHDFEVPASEYVVEASGTYHVTGFAVFNRESSGRRGLRLVTPWVHTVNLPVYRDVLDDYSTIDTPLMVNATFGMSAGQSISMQVYSDTNTDIVDAWLSVVRVNRSLQW